MSRTHRDRTDIEQEEDNPEGREDDILDPLPTDAPLLLAGDVLLAWDHIDDCMAQAPQCPHALAAGIASWKQLELSWYVFSSGSRSLKSAFLGWLPIRNKMQNSNAHLHEARLLLAWPEAEAQAVVAMDDFFAQWVEDILTARHDCSPDQQLWDVDDEAGIHDDQRHILL